VTQQVSAFRTLQRNNYDENTTTLQRCHAVCSDLTWSSHWHPFDSSWRSPPDSHYATSRLSL